MHARRPRPESGPLDRRRLAAAGLSALLPGLGQLFNGRRRITALFLVPTLIVLLIGGVIWATSSPTRLAATIVDPAVLGALLTLNLAIMAWRLLASGQAFLDTKRHGPTGRLGIIGFVVVAALIVVPHLAVQHYGNAFGATFERVFQPGEGIGSVSPSTEPSEAPTAGPSGAATSAPTETPTEEPPDPRINVLLVGVDTRPDSERKTYLTDTMVVVSVDPIGHTVSMVSLPRDLVSVPLGNGKKFGPKLNSLVAYGNTHKKEFPDGGMRALQDAAGALLGIDIPYYAHIDFVGFVRMVDAVGGVDVRVSQGFSDPGYTGYGWKGKGFSIAKGTHHLNGATALAYARSRKAAGESDFTRAARQQQILVGLRDAVTDDGSLLWELPDLLDAVGDTITTNVPRSLLPELAVLSDEISDDDIVRAVIRHPLVASKSTRYGSSLVPDLDAIAEVAAELFPPAGETPVPWPTPKP